MKYLSKYRHISEQNKHKSFPSYSLPSNEIDHSLFSQFPKNGYFYFLFCNFYNVVLASTIQQCWSAAIKNTSPPSRASLLSPIQTPPVHKLCNLYIYIYKYLGFPCGSAGKQSACRFGFDSWVGNILWRREMLPTPVFWPGEFYGLYSPLGWKESETTEWLSLSLHQFSLVFQLYLTLCNPMDCSMPGLPVHHQFLEPTQTHIHWVGDVIQPSHPLSSPSPPFQMVTFYFIGPVLSLFPVYSNLILSG